MQIHPSRSQEDAAASLAALSNKAGTGHGNGWEGTVSSGYVKALGSDVDMKVFRKHWSLEKVFHPISHIHIRYFISILLLFAVRYFISVSDGVVKLFCTFILCPVAFYF